LPIDFFFRSLAQELGERAMCVVLSGTGSDGSLGARAVKGEGGLVLAQSPESTEHDGMPRSVIATGVVDLVLPPAEMPTQLLAYAARAFGGPRPAADAVPPVDTSVNHIFVLLRQQTGHDFSQYKQNTVRRRIERRMAVQQIEHCSDYELFLRRSPEEVEELFRDLLIGVTSFFRDPEAFAAVEKWVDEQLFEGRPSGAPVRVWVPGCSTGEEAYSLAMVLWEKAEALRRGHKVQIFATDIDSRAVATARAGVYPASIAADVSPERLARFFTLDSEGATYRIRKEMRDLLVFSEQDVAKDPPFSRLDLISCRNLLIYMGADLQHRLIPLFHYGLKSGGALFLGTSETVGEFADLFTALDRKAKLYARRDQGPGTPRTPLGLLLPDREGQPAAHPAPHADAGRPRSRYREITERALLNHLAPVAALTDEQGNILYLHGRSGQYLEPAPGEATLNAVKMAREGLRHALAAALTEAAAQAEPVVRPDLRVRTNGDFTVVHLTVKPLMVAAAGDTPARLFLVLIEPDPQREPLAAASLGAAADASGDGEADARLAALRTELRAKEDFLQATNEELETTNEELKCSNEEMQSVNEELQSTNEELETSKEELQSVNEELATVNAELQQRVADLSRVNNDMVNLLAGSGVGTVFVDHALLIKRFTPSVTQVINLIGTDVGRPLGHIVPNLVGYDSLVADVEAVLDTLTPRDIEVQSREGAWFLLRIRPYRTLENVIEGAVITFTDITETRQARDLLRETDALRRLAAVVRDSNDAVTVQDIAGRIVAWNPGAERLYGWTEAEALARPLPLLRPTGEPLDLAALVHGPATGRGVQPCDAQRLAKDGRTVAVSLVASALVNEAGQTYAVATTERALDGGGYEQ
ncbi:MAG: PAS domain-containing protein, partial [Armatimonadetes bacterium]|nr:PAS domain-containing protein [Armatimonadota bacterium]